MGADDMERGGLLATCPKGVPQLPGRLPGLGANSWAIRFLQVGVWA